MSSQVVFAAYKPNEGKEDELKKLIQQHVPVLRDLELITDRPTLTLKAKDGTYIEVIEWIDVNAADQAHEHPRVAEIWEKMGAISQFIPMSKLPESARAFSHYEVIDC